MLILSFRPRLGVVVVVGCGCCLGGLGLQAPQLLLIGGDLRRQGLHSGAVLRLLRRKLLDQLAHGSQLLVGAGLVGGGCQLRLPGLQLRRPLFQLRHAGPLSFQLLAQQQFSQCHLLLHSFQALQ